VTENPVPDTPESTSSGVTRRAALRVGGAAGSPPPSVTTTTTAPETRRLEVAGAGTATMEVTDSPTGRSVTVFSAGTWVGLGPSSLDLALSGPLPGTATRHRSVG
jgi:hypothetical protein